MGADSFVSIPSALPPQQGHAGQFLETDGTTPLWATAGGGFTNPMTTLGDTMYEDATPTAARLAGNATAIKQFLSSTGTGSAAQAPAWSALGLSDIPVIDPTATGYLITLFDDLNGYQTGTNVGPLQCWAITNGTGSANQRDQPSSSETNRFGIQKLSGGSASGAYALLMANVQAIFLGSCAYSFSTAIQMVAVGVNAGNDYTTRVGYIDNWPTTNNCAYMTVDYSIASDHNWKLVTKKGGTATVTDTGVAADTNWHNIRVEINAAGTSVTGYIDGVLKATNATNIPNNTVIGPAVQHAWVSGSAINIRHDWLLLKYQLSATRGTL